LELKMLLSTHRTERMRLLTFTYGRTSSPRFRPRAFYRLRK
jgi:hypothetical protein